MTACCHLLNVQGIPDSPDAAQEKAFEAAVAQADELSAAGTHAYVKVARL